MRGDGIPNLSVTGCFATTKLKIIGEGLYGSTFTDRQTAATIIMRYGADTTLAIASRKDGR